MRIVAQDDPEPGRRELIARHLRANNIARMPHLPTAAGTHALFLEDEAGEVVGGLWADRIFDWIFVELIIVPESLRGKGTGAKLMAGIEMRARELGCLGVWLDTFGFQARGFYEKLGYDCFATLEGKQKQADKYLMRKYLG